LIIRNNWYKIIASQLNIPAGTVRRWKSTYKWDNERSDKHSERSDKKNKDISWIELENEYVTDIRKKPCSLKDVSKKYSIPLGTVEKYSMDHTWSDKRKNYKENIKQKALEKSSDKELPDILGGI
jgi:uncharacterized protein YjcR